MKAVILAAGEGQRMRPLTSTRPKVMLPIVNKPTVEHIVVEAKKAGVDEFVFVVGYFAEAIIKYFGDGSRFGVKIQYVRQTKQLGTAHAIATARPYIDGAFIVLNGDVIVRADDLKKIATSEKYVIASKEVDDTKNFGVVEVEKSRDKTFVRNIIEKPEFSKSKRINAGVYRFDEKIFADIEKTPKSVRGEYEITTTLQTLINAGEKIECYGLEGRWLDVGMPWDLLTANESFMSDLKAENHGEVEEYATIKGPVIIGEHTIIRSGSYIVGPVVIGEGCDIGPNCFIRPSTAIGNHCRIGNGVEIKNSLIMDDTHIAHLSYVGDSVIGQNCNFGAGTNVANLRLDDSSISTVVKGAVVDSGRRKLGAILGDNVKTGINTSINVGTVIGENTEIGPGAIVKGNIAPHSRII